MRSFVNIITVLVIGFALGGLSASFMIQRAYGVGAINIGPWSAWPFVGGAEVDPYTDARATSDGTIPLGAAEGLSFEATEDSNGSGLRQECRYILSGQTSTARLWTLSAYDTKGELVYDSGELKSAFFSGDVFRFPNGSFVINLSNVPQSGNWLPLGLSGNFRLVLRLYDTPVTSSAGLVEPIMPRIERRDCDT